MHTQSQVNTPNKKSNSAKTKIIFASGRCCHGPYHGLFLLQPLKKENIRDDMNLTYLHIYLNNWQAKHQQNSRSLAQKAGNAQKVMWEQEVFCEKNQNLISLAPQNNCSRYSHISRSFWHTNLCHQEMWNPTLLQGFVTLLSKLLPHTNVTAHWS